MDLYKNGVVSVAWAASVAGMNRMAFASLLADNNISISYVKDIDMSTRKK
jgi:predicted HTH domain antitoxin